MKLQQLVFVFFITSLLMSCNNNTSNKNGFSTITGVLEMPFKTEISLSKIEHGKEFLVSTSQLNDENQFGFSVNPDKEGFYVLGDQDIKIPIYIKGNQEFNIEYNPDGYKLLKNPDVENEILYNWVKSIDTLNVFDFRNKATVTFEDFFPFYEKFIPEMKKLHDNVNSKNERFNELMHAYIDLKMEDVAVQFIFTPRKKHPSRDEMAPFYTDFMKGENFKSEIVLDVPNGIKTLRSHQMFKAMNTGADIKTKDYRKEMFNGVENDALRGHLALEFLNGFKTYNSDYISFIEPLRKDIALSEYTIEEVEKYEITIKTMTPGTQGYPFTYKDKNDKEVSFTDLKGKVVYIDVWATWCAPCKQQIPYIKQLEKDLHGKDIQFVSISLDKEKDHKKWKKFIEDKGLTGIQLFADNDFNTRIAIDYKITGIPRFLLFDKEGKIIDANAKRPSNPELKKQLLQLL